MTQVIVFTVFLFILGFALTQNSSVYKGDGVSTRQHNEPAGNQDVWHYHLHVFPRYQDDAFYEMFYKGEWTTLEQRLPYTEKLRDYFAKQG